MSIPRPNKGLSSIGILVICIVFLIAGFLRLNDLSLYSPDSIRYVIWGNSLAHGKGFIDDTQPDPTRFVEHAPLYSVLIAPVEFFVPLSLTAVKIYTLAWSLLAILLWYRWFQLKFNTTGAIVATLLLVCNPLLLVYSSEALSEVPFVGVLCIILLLAEPIVSENKGGSLRWSVLLIAVATIGLLREVGVAVVIGSTVYFLFNKQFKRAAILFIVAGLSLGLWYVRNQVIVGVPEGSGANTSLVFQHFVTSPETSLFSELVQRIWLSYLGYAQQLGGMLFFPIFGSGQVNLALESSNFSSEIRILVMMIAVPVILLGLYADGKQMKQAILRITIIIGYLLLIFVYPVHDIRFLFPLLPLMIYFFVNGAIQLAKYLPTLSSYGKARFLVPAVLLLMLPNLMVIAEILETNSSYRQSPMGFYQKIIKLPGYPTIYTYPWSIIGQWMRDSVPEGSVIASPAKQIAIMVGNRKVLEANPGLTEPLFEKLIRDNGVGYILTKNRWKDYKGYEFLMAESKRFRFDSVYSIASLQLFKVTSRLSSAEGSTFSSKSFGLSDSTSAGGLLRIGRKAFLEGDYNGAIRFFMEGIKNTPSEPEFVYHTMLAYSFLGDSSKAQNYYERLLAFPQASSFVYLARVHMQAMHVALSARGVPPTKERAIKMNDLALLYWNMGYYRYAEQMSNQSLRYDSTYFWGLLWGFHFNLQLGDTTTARYYYGQLTRIDEKNQVVVNFKRLLSIGDSLQGEQDRSKRSALHLSSARIYRLIELFEESIDEGERALGDDPTNVDALQFLGEAFEHKGALLQANRYYTMVLRERPNNASVIAKSDSIRVAISNR